MDGIMGGLRPIGLEGMSLHKEELSLMDLQRAYGLIGIKTAESQNRYVLGAIDL